MWTRLNKAISSIPDAVAFTAKRAAHRCNNTADAESAAAAADGRTADRPDDDEVSRSV